MSTLADWLDSFGLPGLFVLALFDGEAASLLSGVLAHRDVFSPEYAALTVTGAGLLADNTLFAAGRLSGRFPRIARLLAHPRIAGLRQRINARPASSVAVARFLYGAHGLGTLALGASPIAWARFLALNAAAVALWAHLWVWGGHTLIGLIHRYLGKLALDLAVPLVLLGALIVWLLVWQKNRRTGGYPGRRGRWTGRWR